LWYRIVFLSVKDRQRLTDEEDDYDEITFIYQLGSILELVLFFLRICG